MINFEKDGLIAVDKASATTGQRAILINDMAFLLGSDVSATTATAADVKEGKQFYDAEGTLTQGTLVPQSEDGSYDVNADLDSITTALYIVGGTTITITSAEDIEDVNAELDNLNTELSTIKGE